MTSTSVSFASDETALDLLGRVEALTGGRDCYLVGGSIRDRLLDRPVTDLDLAFDGDASALARAVADALGGHYAQLDRERGTSRVILDERTVRTIDITALRGDVTADLAARDFTIDAIAAPVGPLVRGETVELIDPHGGARDLEARTVRLVVEQALIDDPLRLLRAVRLAVQLDFEVEAASADAVRRHSKLINESASERIRDEIARCFATPRAARAVRLMDSLGLLDAVLPEVTAGRGVTQPKEHYYEVLEHNIETVAALDVMLSEEGISDERGHDLHRSLWDALRAAPHVRDYLHEELSEGRSRATLLKLTGLLHDVAKPETRALDEDGRVRFFGHADLGADTARRILQRLRFSRREVDFAATMIAEHLRPGQLGQDGPPTRRAMFRFFRDTGDAAEGVLLLSLADALAARGPRMTLDAWRQGVGYIAYLLSRRHEDEAVVRPQHLLNGRDVMDALGIGPGREVGRLLAALEEAQAAGEVATREGALEFVRTSQARPGTRTPRPEARLVGTDLQVCPALSSIRGSRRSTAGVLP